MVAGTAAAAALADIIVVNDVITKGDRELTRGASSSAEVGVTAANGVPTGDRDGCNVSGTTPVTVTLSDGAANKLVFASASTMTDDKVVFTNGCDEGTTPTIENRQLLAYTVSGDASFGRHVVSTSAAGGKPGSTYATTDTLVVTVVPRAAGALQATADGTSRINLSWAASLDGDIDGYTIYEGSTAVATTTGARATSTTISGLSDDSSHCYTVRARAKAGGTNYFSAPTTAACARTDALPAYTTPPVITANVSGTQGSNGWYTGNVGVSFDVTDPDSTVSSRDAGCAGASVTAHTAGTTFT